MGQLTWEQRKQIGEALGHMMVLANPYSEWATAEDRNRAWDAYQPDVLGEVIPWLEKNAMGWGCGQESMNGDYVAEWREAVVMGDTFSEAVCALMLAVLESGVTA